MVYTFLHFPCSQYTAQDDIENHIAFRSLHTKISREVEGKEHWPFKKNKLQKKIVQTAL